MRPVLVLDTNVVVAGILGGSRDSPPSALVDGMLEGRFALLLSVALVAEYREVLRRPKLRALHELEDVEIEGLLERIVLEGMLREPVEGGSRGPDPEDRHLWELVATEDRAVLVTGDAALLESPPEGASVVPPRAAVEMLGFPPEGGP